MRKPHLQQYLEYIERTERENHGFWIYHKWTFFQLFTISELNLLTYERYEWCILQNNDSNQDVVVGVASKRPKDDKVIIEELQVANCHLRKMVDSLFHELSTCQRENLELKTRVRYLESMQVTGSGGIIPPPPTSHKTLMQSQSAQPSPHLGIRVLKPEHHSSQPIKTEVTSGSVCANPGLPSPQMFSSSASQSINDSQCQFSFSIFSGFIDTIQDFLCELGMKPHMHYKKSSLFH